MRVEIQVTVSKDEYVYRDEDKVQREAVVKAEPEAIQSVRWEGFLAGLAEGAVAEYLVTGTARELSELEGGD